MGEGKVYCVMQSELYGDGSCLDKVFKDKVKAEKYCELHNEIDSNYCFYLTEKEFADKTFNENVKTADYYNYLLFLDDTEEDEDLWADVEPEKQIYTYDDYAILTNDAIDAYSIESYTKAKAIAVNARNKLLGYYYNPEVKYNLINKIESSDYLSYDTSVCPICGGPIKHPYTGTVTTEQLDEDTESCLLIEVIDEHDNTLGYQALCKHRFNNR